MQSATALTWDRPPTTLPRGRQPSAQPPCADHRFVELLNAYRGSGGLARADRLADLIQRRGGTPAALQARRDALADGVVFEWQAHDWLPLFQFNRSSLVRKPELEPLFATLAQARSRLEVANWFVQPNAGLAGRVPVARLESDLPAVLRAAHADCRPGRA